MRIFIGTLILFIVGSIFFLINIEVKAEENVLVSAENAILMDQHSGRVVFNKDGYIKRPVASITKVMTAIVAIEHGNLKDEIRISKQATQVSGSSIYLEEGERFTLEDLLYGLMLRSGNDAAVAIAEHIGGSVEGFVHLMNETASYVGLTDTNFMNPHGLDEQEHYSTAYDIALLMRYAMGNEIFQQISNTKSYHAQNRDYKWFNKNKLLTHLYDYSTGGKTGFTSLAGRTLVTTATKEDISLIVVTLNAPNDWNDHIHLFETYFNKLTNRLFEAKGKRKIRLDENSYIYGTVNELVILPMLDEEISNTKKEIRIHENKTDNTIGSIAIQMNGETVWTVPIYTNRPFLTQMKQLFLEMIGVDAYG